MPDNAEATLEVNPLIPLVNGGTTNVILDHIESETPYVRYLVGTTPDNGLEVQQLDEESFQPSPRRPKGERTVSDLRSFLAELARRPLGAAGTLWGNADRGEIHACYNDHNGDTAGWRDDTLIMQLKKDPDWAQWHAISGKAFRQTEFGDVIEELLHTVVSPDQADLMEIIDSVRASTKGEFNSEITRANGGQKVTYNNEVTTSAGRTREIEVPQLITLRLRPWEGHETEYDIEAYFRLRVDGGSLTLTVKLKPTRQILRDAWADITTEVEGVINKPVYAQK